MAASFRRWRRQKAAPPRETALAVALRAARLACRKPMNEVGKALGISARTVARWESGRTAPPPRRREQLREVLAPLPAPLAERLTRALGLAMPAPPPPPEAQRALVDDRIRVAADRADIRASELRAALASLVPELIANGVSLDAVATALGARA